MGAHWTSLSILCILSCLFWSLRLTSCRIPQQNELLLTSTTSSSASWLVTVKQVESMAGAVPDTAVEYVVNGSNQSILHLILHPNHVIMSPTFAVEVRGGENRYQVESMGPSAEGSGRFLYQGHVREDASSMVAVHLQLNESKMNGLIGFGGHSYSIEPASDQRYHLLQPLSVQTGHQGRCPSTISNTSSTKQSFKADSALRNPSERRRRSFTRSRQKFIETTVVVDQSMADFHGNQTVQYVMSIMNMVHRLFRDQSIGHAIDIIITQLIILNTTNPMNLTGEANKDLNNFCKWMHQRQEGKEPQRDLSLLLTRNGLCVSNHETCQKTWGLAYVAGACEEHNCALVEDRGFLSAFSIAHEVGHSLGMQHDDEANSHCLHSRKQPFIMMSHWKKSKIHTRWSTCSKHALRKFLQTAKCLNNNPHHANPLPHHFPGQIFKANDQCRFNHGQTSQMCQTKTELCQALWCQNKSTNGSCYTTGLAAVDGTSCGHKKVCWVGRCVKQRNVPEPIDGSWGAWTAYQGCSRTCGGGVATSERPCDQPNPTHGGRYCVGERRRYSLCNTQKCPPGSLSFRAQQCAQQNNIPYKNALNEWLPETLAGKDCQLICRTKGQYQVALLGPKLTDGTPCKGNGVCIDGQCHSVGCDNIIDSSVKMDRCSVCGGDNSTCRTYSFLYREQHSIGYERACQFPVGAQRITVIERQPSINFLALKTTTRFAINGEWKIMSPGIVNVAGTRLKYWRNGRLESFTAMGPISEELSIYVIFQGTNPGVLCEFVITNATHLKNKLPTHGTKVDSSGTWVYMSWAQCSKTCGSGVKIRTATCIKDSQLVDRSFCRDQPVTEMTCHTEQCPRWRTHKWKECSSVCGAGVQTRHVICQHTSAHGRCPFQTKPIDFKPCIRAPCGNWTIGNWSECSGECGTGVKSRTVSCISGVCNPRSKPTAINVCNQEPCYKWAVGPWTKCSTSCGDGVRKRILNCVIQQSGHVTSSRHCNNNMKPPASQQCHLSSCPHYIAIPAAGKSCDDSDKSLCYQILRLSDTNPGICLSHILSICCRTCEKILSRTESPTR